MKKGRERERVYDVMKPSRKKKSKNRWETEHVYEEERLNERLGKLVIS